MRWLPFLVGLGQLLVWVSAVRAQEARVYLRGDYAVYHLQQAPVDLSVGPFLRIEERFRAEGLVLDKLSVGAKAQLFSWLTTQIYYAHKDVLDDRRTQQQLAVGEIIVAHRLDSFRLLYRSGNEWHAPDGFYRNRNYFEALWRTPISRLSLWAAEELRVDSDQARIDQNDVAAGVQIVPSDTLSLRLFYDFESLHRSLPSWENTWYVGLAISLRAARGAASVPPAPASPASRNLGHD